MSVGCGHPIALTLLLAGGLLVSCKDDMDDSGHGKPLDEGRYPVIPTALVQAVPQGNGTEKWAGGEQIAVQAVSSPDGWDKAEYGVYEASADSVLTSPKPIWWKYSRESKKVRAWFCGDSTTADKGVNATAIPSVWAVQADQSGDGYNESRLLYAPAREVGFAPSRIVPLRLYHQTAKIVISSNKDGYVSSAGKILSVTIGGMTLSGRYSAPESEGETVGTWTADENAERADLRLHRLDRAEGTALVSYAALVVPQELAGMELTVTTDNGDVKCNFPDDDEAPVAGNVRNYKITVKGSGNKPSGLVVEAVTVKTAYGADDLKFGDYFYSDGTTSDGGLRAIYTDGTFKLDDKKPGPVSGKQVVGIVFQTDPERIGQAEKDALGGECSGLAVALKNAANDVNWGPKGSDEPGTNNVEKRRDLYNDISGYANYTSVCTAKADVIDTYPAFKAVVDFNEACPVTGTTTGWFLPSAGQLWDVMQILGDCTLLADPANQTSTAGGWEHAFKNVEGYIGKLNEWMKLVTSDSKDVFEAGKKVGTSSERHKDNSWYWIMNKTDLFLQGGAKTTTYNVRSVIAFRTTTE